MSHNKAVTLDKREYYVAADMAGSEIVIVRKTKTLWKKASARDSLRMLAGLKLCPLRIVE